MGRMSLRKDLFIRWILWGIWTFGVGAFIFSLRYLEDLPLIIFMSIWVLGIFFGFLFGPGWILSRVWNIQKIRKEREFDEMREKFHSSFSLTDDIDEDDDDDLCDSDDEDYFDKYYDRHIEWLEGMRMECTRLSGSIGHPDTYSSPFLSQDLPLDDFEHYAGTREWNSELSKYIDWEEFREWFPGMATYEDEEDEY